MDKIKIGIIGACITRDAFVTKFVPNYKEYYNVVNTTFQTSFISLMSGRIELSKEYAKDYCTKEYNKDRLKEELEKKSLDYIIKAEPDYIIFDLYSDVRFGVVRYKENYITNSNIKIRQTEFYKQKKYDEIITFFKDSKRYSGLLIKYFENFLNIIYKELPNTRVILVKARYAHSYVDEDNIVRYMDFDKYNYIDDENMALNKLNDMLINKFNLDFIDMTEKEYFADPNYPYGFAPWHFEKLYYNDLLNKLNAICLKDMLRKRKKIYDIIK